MYPRAFRSLAIMFILASCVAGILKSQKLDNEEGRASEIYQQARTAIGGETALNSLHTISATGEMRAVQWDKTLPLEFRMDLILPDKLLKSVRTNSAVNPPRNYIEALNGDEVWTDLSGIQDLAAAGGQMEGVPIGGGGQPGREVSGTSALTAATNARLSRSEIEKRVRTNLSSLLTALLLPNPATLQLKCRPKNTQAMVADVSDILEFSVPGGLIFDLYIDRITHRPAMISYRLPVSEGEPATPPGSSSRTERRDTAVEPSTNRVQAFLSDYRMVSDKGVGELWLPHRITWAVDGRTSEDIRIQTFKLNPLLNPKLFEKRS